MLSSQKRIQDITQTFIIENGGEHLTTFGDKTISSVPLKLYTTGFSSCEQAGHHIIGKTTGGNPEYSGCNKDVVTMDLALLSKTVLN